MEHGPPAPVEQDNAIAPKTRLGVALFIVYGLLYAGFVVINTLSPPTMGSEIVMGLNLAVVYGFGLIIVAIILGLIYNYVCTRIEHRLNDTKGGDEQ
ncbi:MAG: DUF485 domain-containing protein [Anaerolineae bacterium]|nr:DUF485 domain-containing protein [Anaerolineae bacterium]